MTIVSSALDASRTKSFDVVCSGQASWGASAPLVDPSRARGGGFVRITKMLKRAGLRVGWAAVLDDDRHGRALLARMKSLDVEVGAVKLAARGTELVVVDASGAWSGLASARDTEAHAEIPASWSSRVLLLSGVEPDTTSLALLCRGARRARRDGTVIVLDLVGSLREWHRHDPRLIGMLVREADVVCCSLLDLAVIGTDTDAVRRASRPNATLVLDDDRGVTATGAFGSVRVDSAGDVPSELLAEGYTAAICLEYARPRAAVETPQGRWHRILRHEAPKLVAAVE